MRNDLFKDFVAPYVGAIIEHLGGIDRVRDLHAQMPESILHFVAGGVFGLVADANIGKAEWRDPHYQRVVLNRRDHPDYQRVVLNQEEIRRVLDIVRLHLETGSATS